MAKRLGGVVSLHGPRPQPLSLPSAVARPSKRPRGNDDGVVVAGAGAGGAPGPVIVYEHTPKVIHVRPDEFKALVQRLTGRQQQQQQPVEPPAETTAAAAAASPQVEEAGDPLVLTLAKQQAPPRLQLHDDDHYTMPTLMLPSPGGGNLAGADFLFSPGGFLFSPATMKVIQELIS